MNLSHRWLCSSARWKKVVETYMLPWTLEGLNLGSDVLEVGPGPGASTDLLHARVARLTCVEADHRFAEKLRRRLDQSVCVMCEDAMAMSLPDESFDGAVCSPCFTMYRQLRSRTACYGRLPESCVLAGSSRAQTASTAGRPAPPPVRHDGRGRPCYVSCAAKGRGFQRDPSRCNGTVCFSIPREEVNRGSSEANGSM